MNHTYIKLPNNRITVVQYREINVLRLISLLQM